MERSRVFFLFRADAGQIDAATWRRGTLLLAGMLAALAIGWWLVEPYADHGLDTTPLMTAAILAANLYRLLFGFAILLILISNYNLSAKRWRDIGRPAALAGLLPFAACICAALHWLEPRVEPALPHTVTIAADLVFAAILLWNVVELGGLRQRRD
jgi:uncharacterized membrane protein YhaH (DUF805 family)